MSKKRFKQYLMLLTVVGLVAIAAGGGSGTFASFTAETTNPGNVFATGTIVLSNTVNAGSACLSTGLGTNTDTNAYAGCDQIFATTVSKPGDSALNDLDLQNAGSINATTLTVTVPSCANSDNGSETYHGSGNPCSAVAVYIQEWNNAAHTTATHCWYGGGVGNTCAFDPTKTLATLVSAGAQTLTGGLNASADRYFTIGVELPGTAGNTYQGRAATADMTWDISQ